MERYLNTKEAADYLKISIYKLRELAKSKSIAYLKLGKSYTFDCNDLEAYASKMKQLPTRKIIV